ncbi:hypothetical protein [Pollutibacter soli]|uniref:hypothetical protein n=1 Tax=Pollutibacter soli TaxID=3034157 RepID=UPI003013DFAD
MATENNSTSFLRPKWITWTCIAFWTAGLIYIIMAFAGYFATFGLFYSAVNLLLVVILFAALSGVWSMEKWGVILFAIILALKIGYDLFSKAFQYWELVLLVPVIMLLLQYKKMK